MPAIPGDFMGYDRAITVFSPDGRLLQVEYARKTVQQGTPAIGVVCSDGIVLAADKRIVEKLVVPKSMEKVMQIDKHMGVTMSGLISDGRILVEKAQEESQRNKILFDEPIDILTLTKIIGDYKQMYTQYAGLRPFGVSLLIGGVDDEPRLFVTEPSGIFFEYKATAIGKNAEVINKILEKEYREDMDLKQGVNLCVNALKKTLVSKFDKERIDIAVIPLKTKEFKRLSQEEIEAYTKKR
jgi:proteasome alpha subunit